MWTAKVEEASMGMLETDHTIAECLQEVEMDKKLPRKYLRIFSPESPAKLYCCYAVIMVLTAAVIAVSDALSGLMSKQQHFHSDLLKEEKAEETPVIESSGTCKDTCPRDWVGFGSKCFRFSEDMRNWTFSQTYCMAQEAHLARFESLEELNFLKRYKESSNHWIGLHRESPEHPWMWTDNTEYNNLVLTRGGGECGYLSDIGISSSRDYTHRKWICSKSNSCTLQCPEVSNPG